MGDQTKTSLDQVLVGTLNHATFNVYSPKAFKVLIHKNVTRIVFVIVSEIYLCLNLPKQNYKNKISQNEICAELCS